MSGKDGSRLSVRARIAHLLASLVTLGAVSLLAAPSALARYGRGLIGQTTDKTVTFTALLFISSIVVLISVLSLIQWRLDKRKAARKAAEHAHVAEIDWRGGW